MVLWIGVDDTDSLRGMCTTFLAAELVRELTRDHDLIGYPRLVRLNPNIPWKTRGNGAVCIRIGQGRGASIEIGELDGREIRSFSRARGDERPERIRDPVARLVEQWSEFGDSMTNPGFCILPRPPAPSLYWKAVRGIVSKQEAVAAIRFPGIVREYKNGRGIIGALAASSWRPRDRTYELLCYRERSRWGRARNLDANTVRRMDRRFPSTFNNYDYDNDHLVIAPHSPCPILFGIRGDDPSVLPRAMRTVRCERPASWLIFETNQGTDDHVRPSGPFEPLATVRLEGRVSESPRTIPGGHVVFQVDGRDVTAYEPSKGFRNIVRGLLQGDLVQVVGSVRDKPRTLNLEKLNVLSLSEHFRKVANPLCVDCGKRAKSLGRAGGFRCRRCGHRFPHSSASRESVPRTIFPGWYEPPVGSRRHLGKPLKRLSPPGQPGEVP